MKTLIRMSLRNFPAFGALISTLYVWVFCGIEEAAMEDFSKNLLIAALPGGSYWLLGLLLL